MITAGTETFDFDPYPFGAWPMILLCMSMWATLDINMHPGVQLKYTLFENAE